MRLLFFPLPFHENFTGYTRLFFFPLPFHGNFTGYTRLFFFPLPSHENFTGYTRLLFFPLPSHENFTGYTRLLFFPLPFQTNPSLTPIKGNGKLYHSFKTAAHYLHDFYKSYMIYLNSAYLSDYRCHSHPENDASLRPFYKQSLYSDLHFPHS